MNKKEAFPNSGRSWVFSYSRSIACNIIRSYCRAFKGIPLFLALQPPHIGFKDSDLVYSILLLADPGPIFPTGMSQYKATQFDLDSQKQKTPPVMSPPPHPLYVFTQRLVCLINDLDVQRLFISQCIGCIKFYVYIQASKSKCRF